MKTLLAGVAAVPLVLCLLVYATGLAVVDIREGGPDGTRLIIPVPLALASTALLFVDQKHEGIQWPGLEQHRDAAIRLARELQRSPDARFVEVEGRGERVTVDKSGGLLIVEVRDGEQEVLVRVPIAALAELIESHDGRSFSAGDLLAALRKAPPGECVRVHDGDDHVRVWIW
jgi:hypothetical protein